MRCLNKGSSVSWGRKGWFITCKWWRKRRRKWRWKWVTDVSLLIFISKSPSQSSARNNCKSQQGKKWFCYRQRAQKPWWCITRYRTKKNQKTNWKPSIVCCGGLGFVATVPEVHRRLQTHPTDLWWTLAMFPCRLSFSLRFKSFRMKFSCQLSSYLIMRLIKYDDLMSH